MLMELLVTAIDTISVVEGGRSKAEDPLAARTAREAMLRSETPEAQGDRLAREAESIRAGEARLGTEEKGPSWAFDADGRAAGLSPLQTLGRPLRRSEPDIPRRCSGSRNRTSAWV